MVSYLEVYMLKCNACGKPKKVSRLHVHGNLAEIEASWVCPACEEEARNPAPADESAAASPPADA